MSLLLDALKRAEQEKHARGEGARPAAPQGREAVMPPPHATESLTLAPISSGVPTRMDARNDARADGAATPQAQAQAMFQAKAPPPSVESDHSRAMLWVILGIVIVVTLSAGAYVWWSLKSLAPIAPAPVVRRPPAAPTPPPASLEPAPVAAVVATPLAPATPVAPLAPGNPREALVREVVEGARAPRAATPAAAPRLMQPSEAPRVAPTVAAGYQALRSNDFATARRQYEAALAADPRNLDALLGMATVEAQAGQRGAAVPLYRRALDVDPRNATALAGLAALADYARPDVLEPQLREDAARSPNNAALQAALGDLYAGQARWNDAQAAYFEAHRLDPSNADVAHNLAVSLDQLGKATLAAEYYRRALEARGGRFDRAQVTRRLAEIGAR